MAARPSTLWLDMLPYQLVREDIAGYLDLPDLVGLALTCNVAQGVSPNHNLSDVIPRGESVVIDGAPGDMHCALMARLKEWMPKGYMICRNDCGYIKEGKQGGLCRVCKYSFGV